MSELSLINDDTNKQLYGYYSCEQYKMTKYIVPIMVLLLIGGSSVLFFLSQYSCSSGCLATTCIGMNSESYPCTCGIYCEDYSTNYLELILAILLSIICIIPCTICYRRRKRRRNHKAETLNCA